MDNFKKVLITGSNGFVGSYAIEHFRKQYMVVGMDIHDSSDMDYEYHTVNLLEDNLIQKYHEMNPDIVIHCAGSANVGASVNDPLFDFERNVRILYKMLLEIRQADITPKILFCSSAAVYGNPKVLPISERALPMPISPYGLHKKMCEDICMYFIQDYKFDIKILRIFSAYGERLQKQILWDMYQKYKTRGEIALFGTGEESRDFIHAEDIIKQMEAIIHTEKEYFIYNVASGKEIKIRQLAEIFGAELGLDKERIIFNGKSKAGDPNNWCADIARSEEIGFVPNVELSEGIKRYVQWINQLES